MKSMPSASLPGEISVRKTVFGMILNALIISGSEIVKTTSELISTTSELISTTSELIWTISE